MASVYLLQIYDRVLPSASHATLIALTGVAVFLLSCFGLLDWVRQRLMCTPLERQSIGLEFLPSLGRRATHASPLRSH